MAGTPSLFAGIGAQFFDNNGVILSGGKIYSYEAGTTTPVATYTTEAATTAHPNPIVLDAAGRVPSGGEIWLKEGDSTYYKFILKDSTDVVIATYDYVPGTYSSGDLANTTDPTKGDALVGFRQSSSSGNLTGAVGRTVHQKLQESVSVADFGGEAGVDCAAALVLAAAATTGTVLIPSGAWTATATVANSATILGLLNRIQIGGTFTINIASGTHTLTDPVVVSANVINGLSILGATPVTVSISGQNSVGGSAGAYSVTLNMNTVSGVSSGDYLHTYSVTGTGCPEVHRGIWEITAVDTVNSRVTVKNTAQSATFPTNTITASSSVVLKTILKFNFCDGFVVKDSCIDYLDNVAIVGNSDSYWSSSNVTGTEKGTHGMVIAANTVAVNGKIDNANRYGISLGHVSCGAYVGVNGFDQQGIVTELCGSFYGNFVSSCNNKRRGFYASTASGMRAKNISANGNYLDGCITDIGGHMYSASISCAIANGQRGVSATSSGSIIFDTGIMSYNGTYGGAASSVGYLQATSSKCEYNTLDGVYAEYNSAIYAANSTLSNNLRNGAYGIALSTVRVNTSTISTNGAFGVRSDDLSYAIYSGSTLSGNVSGNISLRSNALALNSSTFYGAETTVEYVNFRNVSTGKGGQIAATSGGDSINFAYDNVTAGTYVTGYRMADNTNGFFPEPDGTRNLGTSSHRWNTVFATTGAINTSDAREKQQIRDLSTAEYNVAVKMRKLIRAFKFNDAVAEKNNKARVHIGVIAQDVRDAFKSEGLTAEDYGILCFDKWDAQEEILEPVLDSDGHPTGEMTLVQPFRPAGDRFGVRYEELLAFMLAAL